MPQRTNKFQQLIHLIHVQMDHGGVVTESKMFTDRVTGDKREVDIVVEAKTGSYDVVLSVECIKHSKKASITWVEQMAKKHETLPTNKLILVSGAGWYKTALRKAQSLNIVPLSINEATSADWSQIVAKANFVIFSGLDAAILSCEALSGNTATTTWLEMESEDILHTLDGTPKGTLVELGKRVIDTHEFMDEMFKGIESRKTALMTLELDYP